MLFLTLVLLVLAYINDVGCQSLCCGEPTIRYSFLRTASPDALEAFHPIATEMHKLPRSNVTMKMQQWAVKYNMTYELNEYLKHKISGEQERQKAIMAAVHELPKFLENIEDVKTDPLLSEVATRKELNMMFNKANRNLADMACCVFGGIRNPNSIRRGPLNNYMAESKTRRT